MSVTWEYHGGAETTPENLAVGIRSHTGAQRFYKEKNNE